MEQKKLYKDVEHKKLSGVCAGLAEFFGIDVTLVRLGWVFISFFTSGLPGVVLYIICACVMEPKPANFQGNGTYNDVTDYSNPTYQQPQQPPYQQPQQPTYNPNDYQKPPQA